MRALFEINQENPEAIFEFTLDMQSKYVSSPYLLLQHI